MTEPPLGPADAFERLERLEPRGEQLDIELLPDGRVRAQKGAARDLVRDRLRSAEILPTGPGWAVLRSHHHGAGRELLGHARVVIAAGTLGPGGWLVADLVGFLASGAQTAVLTAGSDVHRSVYFHRGDVVWATSSSPNARLGAFLLARGKITREQLHAALRDGPAGVGRACVERGYLSADELATLGYAYVVERFGEVLTTEGGMWTVGQPDESALAAAPMRLPAQALLVESLRRFDEFRVYRQRIRSPDTRLRRIGADLDALDAVRPQLARELPSLPADAEAVLRALTTQATVAELVRRTGRGEFEVTRAAYHLLRTNLVAVAAAPRSGSRSGAATLDPREVVHIHGLALSEMMSDLRRTGRQAELLKAVNTFLEEEGGAHRELLAELRLDAEGRLDADALLASFDSSGTTADDLADALGELLFFALLSASDILGRRRGDDLARRVRLIHGMLRGSAGTGGPA